MSAWDSQLAPPSLAQEAEGHRLTYGRMYLRNQADKKYRGVDGWRQSIADAHGQGLIETVENKDHTMVPAIKAILDGNIGPVKRSGFSSGPSFLFNMVRADAWLNSSAPTQPDVGAAPEA